MKLLPTFYFHTTNKYQKGRGNPTQHDAMMKIVRLNIHGLGRPLTVHHATTRTYQHTTTRAGSLSAIHRGLRDTDRARFSGDLRRDRVNPSQSSNDDKFGAKFATRRDSGLTGRAMGGAASPRQQHKLRKKLDKKQEEKENGRDKQTRRKRFLDPGSEFGKQSLVYRLKHGSLKEMADNLDVKQPVKPNRSFRSIRRDRDDERRKLRAESATAETSPRSKDSRPSFEPKRATRDTQERNGGEEMEAFPTRKRLMPMTIKYTTAASQFLYGRSVVKSALERGRRKLYRLYIYGGENRKDSKENIMMERLAKTMGVPITIVPPEDQRLMDKMSMGRPHNGFVLETSPLPNLPVKSLGALEENSTRMGFHVVRNHQTKEEEAINGNDTFIPRSSDVAPKPFVVLLNEIMDPGNLGGLLRTASYLGIDAVGITNRSTSTLTPVVLKSAAGAVEEVSIFSVDDPVQFLEDSRKAGWKTYAAVAPPEKKLAARHADKFITTEMVEQDRPLDKDPCILVLGNEGFGLSKQIKVSSDYELSVPRFVAGSSVDSLNVSVAAGLLCHAFVREPLPQPAEKVNSAGAGEALPASEEKLY